MMGGKRTIAAQGSEVHSADVGVIRPKASDDRFRRIPTAQVIESTALAGGTRPT
jgi:hypothetical protein